MNYPDVDTATTRLYEEIRASRVHGPFIREVESIQTTAESLAVPRVLIAPAAFYVEYPKIGGDGQLVRQVAARFGIDAAVIPVPSLGSVTKNAEIVSRILATESDGSVLLVSLSKGAADVRVALERTPELSRKLCLWVQVGGLVHGTPLADRILDSPWRRWLMRAYLARYRASPDLLSELAHAPGSLLATPFRAPEGLRVINVIACPLSSQLRGGLRRRHRRLAVQGPNDGSTLLRDAIVEPGLVYPVWGANHFFQHPGMEELLERLFIWWSGIAV